MKAIKDVKINYDIEQQYFVTGMQDFNYLYSNSFEVLIELSCLKFVPETSLAKEWINNKQALLKFIEMVTNIN